jgi:tRNA1(Val) A37 N6-methylase TrmN6
MGQGKEMGETTAGGLFGGRVAYWQFRGGHRSGFEPVLLAACVPARAGEKVLEAGTGAGAALLCLAARVAGLRGVGVERDAALARLAAENFRENGFEQMFSVQADALRLPFSAASFDHVMANPPWYDAAGTPSPDPARALAHQASADWIPGLVKMLRPSGSITLILPAAAFSAAAAALRASCGGVTLLPLWPRAGVAAKMVIIGARKGSKSPDKVLAGLVLHDAEGITQEAQEILREGKAVAFL